ncbi:MAG: helix-turn-helix domain-containing protein, partial [Opitutales bacterium]
MKPKPALRIALFSETGAYLRMSLVRGVMAGLNQHPEFELLHKDGMPFSDWDHILGAQPDGVVCALLTPEDCQQAARCRGKVVNVAELMEIKEFPSVYVDNLQCGVTAGRHLQSTGLNHFGYVGIEGGVNSEKRLEGFTSQLPEQVPPDVLRLPPHPDDLNVWSRTTRLLAEWIASLPKPIGIYAFSDVHARALQDAVHSLALTIPGDVAVVGTGNYDMDTLIAKPPLSSVPLNWRKVAQVATEILIDSVNGKRVPDVTLVQPRPVFIRASSNHFFSRDKAIAKALQHIQAHYLEEIHVDEVARSAGISRRVLEKRFRQATSTSVYAFVNQVRLRTAKILLMDTLETLDSVAQQSGFKEARHLNTAMKKELGITPGEYRRRVTMSIN